jgi:hypothetical protein
MVFLCVSADGRDAHQRSLDVVGESAVVVSERFEAGDVAEDGEDEADVGDVVAFFEEVERFGEEHVAHDVECGA